MSMFDYIFFPHLSLSQLYMYMSYFLYGVLLYKILAIYRVIWDRHFRTCDCVNGVLQKLIMLTGGAIEQCDVQITFNCPQDTLISISGHFGKLNSYTVIRSLKFQTSLRKYRSYGKVKGMYFSLPKMGGKIVGFYGKSGEFLDSTGVYCRLPKMLKPPNTSNNLEPSMAALKLYAAAIL